MTLNIPDLFQSVMVGNMYDIIFNGFCFNFTVCAVNYVTSNFTCMTSYREGYGQDVQWECFKLLQL